MFCDLHVEYTVAKTDEPIKMPFGVRGKVVSWLKEPSVRGTGYTLAPPRNK